MSEGPTSHSPLYSEGSPAVGSPLVNREIIVDISANPRERLPTVSASLAEPSIPVSMSVEGDSMDEVRFNQLFDFIVGLMLDVRILARIDLNRSL